MLSLEITAKYGRSAEVVFIPNGGISQDIIADEIASLEHLLFTALPAESYELLLICIGQRRIKIGLDRMLKDAEKTGQAIAVVHFPDGSRHIHPVNATEDDPPPEDNGNEDNEDEDLGDPHSAGIYIEGPEDTSL